MPMKLSKKGNKLATLTGTKLPCWDLTSNKCQAGDEPCLIQRKRYMDKG